MEELAGEGKWTVGEMIFKNGPHCHSAVCITLTEAEGGN